MPIYAMRTVYFDCYCDGVTPDSGGEVCLALESIGGVRTVGAAEKILRDRGWARRRGTLLCPTCRYNDQPKKATP